MKKNNNAVVVFDLDGTISPKGYALMRAVQEFVLSEDLVRELQEERERNLLASKGRLMDADGHRVWLTSSLDKLAEAKVSLAAIKATFQSGKVAQRPGVRECLIKIKQLGIPIAVVSFGVYQHIEHYLEYHKLYDLVDAIYATRLKIINGHVVGYHGSTVVIPENKGEWSLDFAQKFNVPHENIVAVGDTHGDRFIGGLKKHRLGIAEDEQDAIEMSEDFGHILIEPHYDEVYGWIEETVKKLT